MAHKPICLVLLRSRSDTVHRGLLHKTLVSTSLIGDYLSRKDPRRVFCSAKANRGLQGIADSPHSTAILFYIKSLRKSSFFGVKISETNNFYFLSLYKTDNKIYNILSNLSFWRQQCIKKSTRRLIFWTENTRS